MSQIPKSRDSWLMQFLRKLLQKSLPRFKVTLPSTLAGQEEQECIQPMSSLISDVTSQGCNAAVFVGTSLSLDRLISPVGDLTLSNHNMSGVLVLLAPKIGSIWAFALLRDASLNKPCSCNCGHQSRRKTWMAALSSAYIRMLSEARK